MYQPNAYEMMMKRMQGMQPQQPGKEQQPQFSPEEQAQQGSSQLPWESQGEEQASGLPWENKDEEQKLPFEKSLKKTEELVLVEVYRKN